MTQPSNQANVIPIPDLPPAGPAPVAAPMPPAPRRAFRRADATQLQGPTIEMTAFTKQLGRPPILSQADNYNHSQIKDLTPNVFEPSYIAMNLSVFLTNQKFCAHDRFLKESPGYHPDLIDMYSAFLFFKQICRVYKTMGNIVDSDLLTMIADLDKEYPDTELPVPGTFVHHLMALTKVDNPYEWYGPVLPRLPDLTTTDAAHNFRPTNQRASYTPHFWYSSARFRAMLTRARAAETMVFDQVIDILGNQANLNAGNDSRLNIFLPQHQVPNPSTLRVEASAHSYYSNSPTNQAARELNAGLLDLPAPPENTTDTTTMNYLQYFGLIDPPTATDRSNRYRRWPKVVASIVSNMCRYTAGSRYLSDLTPVGIGSVTDIVRFRLPILLAQDPRRTAGNPAAGTHFTDAVRTQYLLRNLEGQVRVRDPEHEQAVSQLSLFAQINIDRASALEDQYEPLDNARFGAFWDSFVCDTGSYHDVAGSVYFGLPSTISGAALH